MIQEETTYILRTNYVEDDHVSINGKYYRRLHHYILLEKIAQSTTLIFLAQDLLENQQKVVIKCLPKNIQYQFPQIVDKFKAEAAFLKQINSPHVVKFYDYFETNDQCCTVIEYCNEGNLQQILNKQPSNTFDEKQAVHYFRQILIGFKAIHQLNILHRDIKLENILVSEGVVKIADLSVSKQLDKIDGNTETKIVGTPYIMAPEVYPQYEKNQQKSLWYYISYIFRGNTAKYYGIYADLYSLGVVLYYMLFGVFPYDGETFDEIFYKIKESKLNLEYGGVKISEEMKDLLRSMLKYDHTQRIRWRDLYKHPAIEEKVQLNCVGSISEAIFLQNSEYYHNREESERNLEQMYEGNNSAQGSLTKDNVEIILSQDGKELLVTEEKIKVISEQQIQEGLSKLELNSEFQCDQNCQEYYELDENSNQIRLVKKSMSNDYPESEEEKSPENSSDKSRSRSQGLQVPQESENRNVQLRSSEEESSVEQQPVEEEQKQQDPLEELEFQTQQLINNYKETLLPNVYYREIYDILNRQRNNLEMVSKKELVFLLLKIKFVQIELTQQISELDDVYLSHPSIQKMLQDLQQDDQSLEKLINEKIEEYKILNLVSSVTKYSEKNHKILDNQIDLEFKRTLSHITKQGDISKNTQLFKLQNLIQAAQLIKK